MIRNAKPVESASTRRFLAVVGALAFLWMGSFCYTAFAHAQNTGAAPERAAPAVADLRCEYKVNPLGIDVERPRLSWRLISEARGAMQSAYRIQVAESEEALQSGEDLLWDTGKVDSDRSIHHAYDGPALEARQRYFWRVRTWDEGGEATGWSAPAWWEMGLLEPSDWEAQWIEPAFEEDSTASQSSPMLRTDFAVDGELASARLYVTAHGLYEMHLNGERVGTQLFTPGWTSYHERLQYQTFDVGDLLQQGENTLGAILGDGWYRGYFGFQGARNQYGTTLALLAQLEVTYADGRTQVAVQAGDGWRAATGPIRTSDIYMGETYDAQQEKPGWATPGYDASDWQGVRTADYSKETLIAPAAPPVRRIQTLKPVRVFETPEGDTVFDMGQNMVGWVRMTVEGEAGTEVTLRHAEVLDKEGNFYTANLRSAAATDRYTLKGGGEEVYEPHFTFHGFRYVAVEGYPGEPTLDDFTGVVIHSDMPPSGHFESSEPLVNQLQHNIVWGQKGNFLDVPTDTPARDERLGWTGDAQVFAQTAAFNMKVASFFTKWLRDLAADQHESGSIPDVIPDILSVNQSASTGWADAGVIVPWAVYQSYGDTRILERQYESMTAWVDYMREEAQTDEDMYVWDTGSHYGDWLAYSTTRSDYPGATTSKDLIATAYFAYSADLLARIAGVLDREEDAQTYKQLSENVKEAFRAEFVTQRGRVTSSTQTAYVLALAFDLLPEDQRAQAAKRLADDVRTRGHLTTGFLGTPDLAHVLSQYGYLSEAYDLLLRTEYPSWLYPVTRGATTMWERWDGIKPDSSFQDVGMNSFNHYAYGAVGDWLYRTVAGVEARTPGYKEILIAPRPGGGLSHARARLISIHGPIESSWAVEDSTFRLSVHIPANTRARVRLPKAAGAERVTEGGQPLAEADGVERVRQDGEDVTLDVGAGRYVFAYDANRLLPDEETEDQSETAGPDAQQGGTSGEGVPGGSFSAETKLADLLADAAARAIIEERLPVLYNSPWLSQTMGFPLERASSVIPVDISEEAVQAVDEVLRNVGS